MSIVTPRFIGRLGNNMFQVAACIGYAKKHNMRWAAPENTRETPNFHKYFPGLPKTGAQPGQRYQAHDPSMFGYHEIPNLPGGVTLVGFFQSVKYFDNAENEVKNAFKLKYEDGLNDYTSIHIRRGDYVQYANSFPPVTVGYILQAIERTPSQRFIICSDDIDWCRHALSDHFSGLETIYSVSRTEYEDLCLMASCGHHIIANSTFSWWGAYLGQNPDKIIVSPHHTSWFGPDGPKDTKDLIPEYWHQIKFR